MTSQEDQEDSEYEGNKELARLLMKMIRKKQREHLPRYKGGGRSKNQIGLYFHGTRATFVLSYDVVCRLYQWTLHMMNEPPIQLTTHNVDKLRLHVIRFKRKSTPMILLRMVEFSDKAGQKLTRAPRGWRFTTSLLAAHAGLDPAGGHIRKLEIVPYPAMKGYLVILPDTHRAYKARREDISQFLAEMDPDEPPRFKFGKPDPEYVAKRAAEAAERKDQ